MMDGLPPPGRDAPLLPPDIMDSVASTPPQGTPGVRRRVRLIAWRTRWGDGVIYKEDYKEGNTMLEGSAWKGFQRVVAVLVILIVLVVGWLTAHPRTVPCDFCGRVVEIWYKTDFVPEYATPLARVASAVTSVSAVPSHTHYEICPDCYQRVMIALSEARE